MRVFSILVLEAPSVPVTKGNVNRHLRNNHRSVSAHKLCTHDCDWWLLLVLTTRTHG